LIYACQVWGQENSALLQKIENLQDKALRIINFLPNNYPISETYKKYIQQIEDALKNKSSYRKNLYIQSLFTFGLYLFLILYGLTQGFEFSLLMLIAYQILKFIKKNKIIYLFKIEGPISIVLNIYLDLIKIFIITRSII